MVIGLVPGVQVAPDVAEFEVRELWDELGPSPDGAGANNAALGQVPDAQVQALLHDDRVPRIFSPTMDQFVVLYS